MTSSQPQRCFEDQNAATPVSSDSFTLSRDLGAIGIAAAAASDPAAAVADAINAALAANASPLADVVEAFQDRGQVGLRTLTSTGSTAIITDIARRNVATAITDALGLQTDQTGQRLPIFETAQQFACLPRLLARYGAAARRGVGEGGGAVAREGFP